MQVKGTCVYAYLTASSSASRKSLLEQPTVTVTTPPYFSWYNRSQPLAPNTTAFYSYDTYNQRLGS